MLSQGYTVVPQIMSQKTHSFFILCASFNLFIYKYIYILCPLNIASRAAADFVLEGDLHPPHPPPRITLISRNLLTSLNFHSLEGLQVLHQAMTCRSEDKQQFERDVLAGRGKLCSFHCSACVTCKTSKHGLHVQHISFFSFLMLSPHC